MNDAVGYFATLLVLISYFFRQPKHLRRVQAVAAFHWTLYGVLIDSMPVIVANILVAAIAIWSSIKIAPKASSSIVK